MIPELAYFVIFSGLFCLLQRLLGLRVREASHIEIKKGEIGFQVAQKDIAVTEYFVRLEADVSNVEYNVETLKDQQYNLNLLMKLTS